MRLRLKRKGFTLLELMIVSGILIIVLTGLLGSFIACIELTQNTKNANLALTAVVGKMEEIRGTPSENFLNITSAYGNRSYSIAGMSPSDGLVYVSVDDTNTSLINISICACWRQRTSRIIGECTDSSGIVVFSDNDSDNVLDSQVQLSSLMAQR